MTTQLRLVDTPQEDPEDTPGHSDESGRRSPRSRASAQVSGSARSGEPHRIRERLDDKTRERGLRGVAQAREALREANRRAAIRDAERRSAKDAELTRLANRAKHRSLTSDGITPDVPHGPGGHAAA